jgi:hypothetical protein
VCIDPIDDSVERAWTHDVPFGDWRYIRQRVIESVSRRLDLSQRLFPQAAPVLERIRTLDDATAARVLEHPVLRSVVFAATRHLKEPWKVIPHEQVERYLEQLGILLAGGWTGGKLPSLSLLMEEDDEDAAPRHPLWQWAGEQGDRTLTGIIPTVFLNNSPNCVFHHPTAEESSNLRQGIALLRELFPLLTPSILRHVDVIALVSTDPARGYAGPSGGKPLATDPLISCSSDTSPGVVFVNPRVLTNPWYIAEVILHEGLHSKLYDVMATHNLLRPNYTQEAAKLHPLWHMSSEAWDVQRSLFAMHVYAHLALFFRRVAGSFDALAPRFGPLHVIDAQLSMRRSLDRGHFLGMKLAEVGTRGLGPAGHLLLARLQEMLLVLDGASVQDASPEGASRLGEVAQRLVGDLYARQTLALERVLADWRAISSHPQGACIPALLTAVAEMDAALVGQDAAMPPASAGVEDTLRVLIDLRKQVARRFMNGGTSPSLDTLIDSASRSGHLFTQAHITVELNP